MKIPKKAVTKAFIEVVEKLENFCFFRVFLSIWMIFSNYQKISYFI